MVPDNIDDRDLEAQDGVCSEVFMQDVIGQMSRGFIEATLYAALGVAVLSQTQNTQHYGVAEAALDGTIGGVLVGVATAFINKGLTSVFDRVHQSRPCTSTTFFMASPVQQAKTLAKWLAQSTIYASAAGLGSVITRSSASPIEAAVAGEVGLGVTVASVAGSVAILASAAGVINFVEKRYGPRPPLEVSISPPLDSTLSQGDPSAAHLLSKKDEEEPLAEKNHVMAIMPH